MSLQLFGIVIDRRLREILQRSVLRVGSMMAISIMWGKKQQLTMQRTVCIAMVSSVCAAFGNGGTLPGIYVYINLAKQKQKM
jgi:hypothetical protein